MDFEINNKTSFSLNDYETHINNNELIIGPPGCGKTTLVSYNLLKNMQNFSHVFVDIKGRMRDLISRFEEMGYKVNNLDLIDLVHSQKLDILKNVETEIDCSVLARSLFGAITSKDPYWDISAINGVDTATNFVCKSSRNGKRNLRNIMKFISMMRTSSEGFGMEPLLEFYETATKDDSIHMLYDSFNVKAATTSSCIKNTITSRLRPLLQEEVLNIFVEDGEIDFESFKTEKVMFIISLKDYDTSLHRITALVLSQLMKKLFYLADHSENGRLKYPVQFWLDDCASYEIPNLADLIATGRSRGIAYTLMFQSINQLEKVYKESAQTILGCCDRILYFGGACFQTTQYMANLTGFRYEVIANLPLTKLLFWQRGQQAMIVDHMDYSKQEDKYVIWNYPHFSYKSVDRKSDEEEQEEYVAPNFLKMLRKTPKGYPLPLSREDCQYLYYNCRELEHVRDWKYKHLLDRFDLDDKLRIIYEYWDLIPKQYFNDEGKFFFYVDHSILKSCFTKMYEKEKTKRKV